MEKMLLYSKIGRVKSRPSEPRRRQKIFQGGPTKKTTEN